MAKDLSARNVTTGNRKSINDVAPNYYKSTHRYPTMSYRHYNTCRYGVNSISFYQHGFRGDKIPLNSRHELETYTLKSPMKSQVVMHKTFFKVPIQAIYPLNYALMQVPPTSGEDVPDDTKFAIQLHKLGVDLFYKFVNIFTKSSSVELSAASNYINTLFHYLIALESIWSHGSLLSEFNIHVFSNSVWRQVVGNSGYKLCPTFDSFFDSVINAVLSISPDFANGNLLITIPESENNSIQFSVSRYTDSNYDNNITIRQALDLMRFNDFKLDFIGESFSVNSVYSFLSSFNKSFPQGSSFPNYLINIECLGAYQLLNAQFYSDDHVDYIYDSSRYRAVLKSTFLPILEYIDRSLDGMFYSWNGERLEYDVLSNGYYQYLIMVLSSSNNAMVDPNSYFLEQVGVSFFNVLKLTFGHRLSLRYSDYFTSLRPNILTSDQESVKDGYYAEVNNDQVSAISTARSMQFTRFWHNVSLAGRRLADYFQMLVPGKRIEAPKDQPLWLADESFRIKGFETENTGSAQLDANTPNTTTTQLTSTESRFNFQTYVDEPCIIIGIRSFDVERIYSKTVDRHCYHFTRYDDPIPELQFIGDQEVYNQELGVAPLNVTLIPHGYAVRNFEEKVRMSYASGGWIDSLPSFAMITDNGQGLPSASFINSFEVRSFPSEFDRFYKSLTGYSIGNYFHFRVIEHNDLSQLRRALVPQPQILK